MKVSQRLWWVIGGVLLLFCVGFVLAAYRFGWSSTGFLNKSLWDWLQLLIVPLALAVIALVFQRANSRTEQQIAKQRWEQDQQIALDKQREDRLQAYLDCFAELMLEKQLRSSADDAEVRNFARARTITTLYQLDARRKGNVLQFLYESGLIYKDNKCIIDLRGANLTNAKLGDTNLRGARLSNTNLCGAELYRTDLREANLDKADLRQASVSPEQLDTAYSRIDTIMPDGSKHRGK